MYVPRISTVGHWVEMYLANCTAERTLFKLRRVYQRRVGREEDGPNLVWMAAYISAQCLCTSQPLWTVCTPWSNEVAGTSRPKGRVHPGLAIQR